MEKIKLLKDDKETGVSLSIVNNYKDFDYTHYYDIFDLKKPVQNIGIIGVATKDQFAIKINNKNNKKIFFSLYLDGVNASQGAGIQNLNDIKEHERNIESKHNGFICDGSGNFYLDRYSQISGKNRSFIFTDIPNSGVNENLISDVTKLNRIEIYFWIENHTPLDRSNISFSMSFDLPDESSSNKEDEIKIGAGEETNKSFENSDRLIEPKFLGKIMLAYVKEKDINKACKYLKNGEFDFKDPMDLIP